MIGDIEKLARFFGSINPPPAPSNPIRLREISPGVFVPRKRSKLADDLAMAAHVARELRKLKDRT